MRTTPASSVAKKQKQVSRKQHPLKSITMFQWFEIAGFCIAIAGFGIAIWALLETLEANELALQASKETQKQTKLALEANELAQQEARESRIINAWQILAIKEPGNTGKREALETLVEAKQEIYGVDLSCKTLGGGWDEITRTCENGVWLRRANLSNAYFVGANLGWAILDKADLNNADFRYATLSGAVLSRAELRGANMQRAHLEGARLFSTDLREVNLRGAFLNGANLSSAKLNGANLLDAKLNPEVLLQPKGKLDLLTVTDLSRTELFDANLSGAQFCDKDSGCAKGLTQDQIDQAWAWADKPPIFEAGQRKLNLIPPPLCDPALRPEYEANNETGKPKGC